ncbi:MAG: peroxiredoxin, partial [Acidobacteria bacterium]|nr:peroxiredoxin [Acidobacteriota bacterium]
LPAGSRIDATAWYDNSANNKYNPDPSKTVRWGDQTFEEMMIGFFNYKVLTGTPPPTAPVTRPPAAE